MFRIKKNKSEPITLGLLKDYIDRAHSERDLSINICRLKNMLGYIRGLGYAIEFKNLNATGSKIYDNVYTCLRIHKGSHGYTTNKCLCDLSDLIIEIDERMKYNGITYSIKEMLS